jgi:ferredoxin
VQIGVIVDGRGLSHRLDLARLAEGLSDEGTTVWLVDGLDQSNLRSIVESSPLEGLVVAARDEARVHSLAGSALHEAGADRFALRIVNLHDLCAQVHPSREATEKARLLLSAALAMLREYRPPQRANIRLGVARPSGRLSRRALLTMPTLRYELVPAVDETLCVASRGCDLCSEVCPAGSVGVDGGAAHILKQACRGCAVCLAACPVGAITHPFYARRVVDAGLRALLAQDEPAFAPKIVAFACPGAIEILQEAGRQRLSYSPAILPWQVPCAGFVDWYLVLRAFDLGAAAVALLGCAEGCRHRCTPEAATGRFQAISRLSDALGLGSARLQAFSEGSAPALVSRMNAFAEDIASLPWPISAEATPTTVEVHRHQVAPLLTGLCRRLGTGDTLSLEDDEVPFGVATIDSARCSLCGLCAGRCPTKALSYVVTGEGARLMFTASECTGCRLCVAACPESSLRIRRRLDLASLLAQTQTLKTASMVRCRRCGQPFASEAMVSRVLLRLGNRLQTAVANHCPDCRMVAHPVRPGS